MQSKLKTTAALSSFLIATLLLCCASPVWAQRNATSKALGDSTPFMGPARTTRYYAPRMVETQRSFSYAPAAHHAGDRVEISAENTKIMKGTETVGTIAKGQVVEVRKVVGPWLGIETNVAGQKMNGWILDRNVTTAGHHGASATEHAPAAAPAPQRSFSVAPTPQVENQTYTARPAIQYYRYDNSPRKEQWQYPKTDPRRYIVH